jgi:hypothetical protein
MRLTQSKDLCIFLLYRKGEWQHCSVRREAACRGMPRLPTSPSSTLSRSAHAQRAVGATEVSPVRSEASLRAEG